MYFIAVYSDDGSLPALVGPYDTKQAAEKEIEGPEKYPDTEYYVTVTHVTSAPGTFDDVWDAIHS